MAETGELFSPDRDWLSVLKPSIRSQVEGLIAHHGSPELAAEEWLSSIGPSGIAPLGAGGNPEFVAAFKRELYAIVCGGKHYAAERKKWSSQVTVAETYVVSGIATALSPTIGAAAALLVPPVALMLIVIGKAGKLAWCQANRPSE